MNTPYQELANRLLFRNGPFTSADLQQYGLEYRRGKTVSDIKKAIQKALHPKNGLAKVEFELSMLELYLKSVLKPIKPTKKEI